MYHKINTKNFMLGVTLFFVLLALAVPYQSGMSQDLIPEDKCQKSDVVEPINPNVGGLEVPKELNEVEFQSQINALDKFSEDHIVLYDLEDPEGIDPDLLPKDIAALVDGNTKVVAYRETTRPDSIQSSGASTILAAFDKHRMLGIPCASPDGTRDTTTSTNFGSVTQYSRVYALRYDDAPWNPAQPLTGWEFETQWAKWTRTDTAWYVADAKMKLEATQRQDYCTGVTLGGLNYSSTTFDPTFYGNSTNWFSISGFANTAYVPSPYHLVAYTQGDIYQGYSLQYNDAKTRQYFSKTP
ncbi:MAG: hypothetical protein H0S79_23220 [Anaerolineaceae bacterium]|nr:hypothetical protein [Anaerolineaceae bacterium]